MPIERTVVDMDFVVTDASMVGEAGSPFYRVMLLGETRYPCNISQLTTPSMKFRLRLIEVIADDDHTIQEVV